MLLPRPLRWLVRTLVFLILLGALGAAWLAWYLNGSLAALEGEQVLAGLAAPVSIERDAQGIPTIRAGSRLDRAFALGFLHAQERFFQMDLLRRNAAGELSALVGAAALEHDRSIRVHQFRKRGREALTRLPPAQHALAQAYTDGVNSGLAALDTAPFEYLLLQTEPAPWRPEDSMLALYSMYLDLQPELNQHERSLAALRDALPADWFRFMTPEGGRWDSPIHGEAYTWRANFPAQALATLQQPASKLTAAFDAGNWHYRDEMELGSNNWSVAGSLTAHGGGMVANDMHLGLRVPNIWYRASWYLDDGRRVSGATLPGAPSLVVGSNGHIAWGFTNSNGDYHDSIILKTNEDESRYLTPDGWQDFGSEREVIAVKGGEPQMIEIRGTRWGPVVGRDHQGRLLALRWVAHDPEGANLNIANMESASTVEDALAIAATAGMPGQNLNVVDRAGNQGWTIMGRLPKRRGYAEAGLSPRDATDWSSGELGWDGYLPAAQYPRVVNPEHGRIWTANARIVSGELLDKVGRGGYALGARQQQIEKGMFDRERMDEADFLEILLDDRAIFFSHWQQLLLQTLNESAIEQHPELAELKDFVANWGARASAESVGYLAVKVFRQQVIDHTLGAVLRQVAAGYGSDESGRVFWPAYVDNFFEYPVWSLVEQRPSKHVPAGHQDWDGFLLAMANETLASMTEDGRSLAEQTWGRANTLAIHHPLTAAVPALGRWLNMPAEPMPGDTYMPRVQSPSGGASERMVVAPGHEQDGIFHMATGQSGHPLSSYYDYGHRDWVEGKPSAFLPGETRWRLQLLPK